MDTKYDKVKIIGSGTFANVWLVKSRLSRHTYVLKEIQWKTLNETDRQHAWNEVNILSNFRHKHIIRYKEAIIESDKALSIVMEYAEGGDLHSAILRQKGVPFSERRIITWFIQMCLALQYIHYRNILHRDLKSQNIFLTRNQLIKVGDFGIARVLKNPEELAKTAIGTPYYLSPEICQRKPYNHKSDIWALGCILFEISALEHPFQAVDFIQLVSLILEGRRKELPRDCSSIIQDLVKGLLDSDPERRPSTEVILAYTSLQPYLSEYVLTHGSRESFLPVLISPKMKSRGNSVSDFFKNFQRGPRKRRSFSTSEINQNVTKSTPEATTRAKGSACINSRKCLKKPPNNASNIKLDKKQESQCNVSNLKFVRLKRRVKQISTALTDTFTLSESDAIPSTSRLIESEDPILDDMDYGYQSCNTNLNPSGSSNKEKNGVIIKSQYKIQHKNSPQAFPATQNAKNSPTAHGEMDPTVHICKHSQCHQCMLDMLWRNLIRCDDEGSVNIDEYSRLRNKLFLLYEEDLFEEIYQSLLLDSGGNKSTPFPSLLNMMPSLNFEQVQSLPLMMQLVQLDVFMKSKQISQNESGVEA